MAQGGKREGAGRKRLPYQAKRVPIAMRVSPACADWLRDKALYYGCSLGQMVEQMMLLWQEHKCECSGNSEAMKDFCRELEKKIPSAIQERIR